MKEGKFEEFEKIVRSKPNIINSLRDGEYGRTLLMKTVFEENLKLFNRVLSFGADLSIVNDYGWNVFHWIAYDCFNTSFH